MPFDLNLTENSNMEIDTIVDEGSLDNIYRYLNTEINLRSFWETLSRFYDGDDLFHTLADAFCRYDDSLSRDSVLRKIRNWQNDRFIPVERKEHIKICFALGLDEDGASALLSIISDRILHLCNPFELSVAFCLRTGSDFPDAVCLFESLEPLPKSTKNTHVFTKTIANRFSQVKTIEDFYAFYKNNAENFSIMHNTAYSVFNRFLSILEAPGTDHTEENCYSAERIINDYLRMNVPLDKCTSNYDIAQKTIRKYWPNVSSLTRMKNREQDVTRKILLLLYIVTEGGINPDDESEAWLLDEDFTSRELFEEHYWRLNAMLVDCGMGRLDPRNVFDWLVLYSLKKSDDDFMSERMQRILDGFFSQ